MDINPTNVIECHGTEGKLAASWCLWEKYQSTQHQTRENYADNLKIIYRFNTLNGLAALWKHTPYGKPSKLLYDKPNTLSKKFIAEKDEEELIIEFLVLFKEGVKPEWEDPQNKNGCSLHVEIKDATPEQIDKIWKSLVFGLVGGTLPYSEKIMGIRMLDRLKKHDCLKCEVWTSFPCRTSTKDIEIINNTMKSIDELTDHLHLLYSEIFDLSVHSIILKDHYVASKI